MARSSGKSSVSESVVGKDFLPRGSATVRKEITDETDRETGRSKQISTVPIYLSLYSPNVVNLTLIDLPGLTKVAIDGQSESIVQDIENMVRSYIEKGSHIKERKEEEKVDMTNSMKEGRWRNSLLEQQLKHCLRSF
ncbi:unnamed protein product [Camellia sinensis]